MTGLPDPRAGGEALDRNALLHSYGSISNDKLRNSTRSTWRKVSNLLPRQIYALAYYFGADPSIIRLSVTDGTIQRLVLADHI